MTDFNSHQLDTENYSISTCNCEYQPFIFELEADSVMECYFSLYCQRPHSANDRLYKFNNSTGKWSYLFQRSILVVNVITHCISLCSACI